MPPTSNNVDVIAFVALGTYLVNKVGTPAKNPAEGEARATQMESVRPGDLILCGSPRHELWVCPWWTSAHAGGTGRRGT